MAAELLDRSAAQSAGWSVAQLGSTRARGLGSGMDLFNQAGRQLYLSVDECSAGIQLPRTVGKMRSQSSPVREGFITAIAASAFALAACNTAPSPELSRQQSIADYRAKAESIAARMRLTHYKFLGVELFHPFDPTGYEKERSELGGLTFYKAIIPDSAFPVRIVSVAPNGTAVEVMGLKPVGSIPEGKTYMREVVEALKDRLPQLREYDEQEDDYSVHFLPRTQFVEWYAATWDHIRASYLERDYNRGYKSEFYYAQNKQPDDLLSFIRLAIQVINGQPHVMFFVQSNESVILDDVIVERRQQELKERLGR